MAYKKTDYIYIQTTKLGYLPPLRQYGPIPNPLRVTVAVADKCLAVGIPIHQFDPDSGKVIRLTKQNLYDDSKFSTKTGKVKEDIPVIPKPVEVTVKTENQNVEIPPVLAQPEVEDVPEVENPNVKEQKQPTTESQVKAYNTNHSKKK